MKLDKKILKALIMESMEEMHGGEHGDPRDDMATQLESQLLSMTGGDKEMAAQVLERLKDMIVGAPEPEYDEEAEAKAEKRFMQTYDSEE